MKRAIVLALFIQTTLLADPHPYSITEVRADIQDSRIILTIKTNAEDLIYFHQLAFDSLFTITRDKLLSAAREHTHTLQAGFTILDQQGKPLPSRITTTNFSSLDAKENFGAMELLKYPLYYSLQFDLADGTELLEFHQSLAGLPAVSILSISKNGNQLAGNIELSKDKTFTMNRRAVSIGLASEPNFLVSYFSLTDTHITHELTLPFTLLKSLVQSEGSSAGSLKTISAFITASSPVEVNSTLVQPEITTLDFQSDGRAPVQDTLLVNIRITYALRSLPKDVSISWTNYNWQVRWFKSVIDAFDKQTEHNFSRFQPTFRTTRKVDLNKKD